MKLAVIALKRGGQRASAEATAERDRRQQAFEQASQLRAELERLRRENTELQEELARTAQWNGVLLKEILERQSQRPAIPKPRPRRNGGR
jgi:predicted RNase H-like nuclease (RuvC/YqgF family)